MDFGVNQGIVEELYSRYRDNPRAVADSWRRFFEAMSAEERAELLNGGAAPTNGNGNGHTETLVGMPAPPATEPVAAAAPAPAPKPAPANGNGPAGAGRGADWRRAATEGAGARSADAERVPGARHRAGPGLPHARPPLRRPRPARADAGRPERALAGALRPGRRRPEHDVRDRQLRRRHAAAAARDRAAPEGNLHAHDRRRVPQHRGARGSAAGSRSRWSRRATASACRPSSRSTS